jgi:multiple sugar transport system permease protein
MKHGSVFSKIFKNKWDICAYIVLTLFSIIILFPIVWTIRTSVAPDIIAYQLKMVFKPTFDHYETLFSINKFSRFIFNSLVIALFSTFLTMIFSVTGAYSVARYKTGGTASRFIILATDLLPPIILVIPLFVLFGKIEFTNTLHGLIISYLAFNIPYALWILLSYFESIPRELEESALIDGATRFQIFIKIVTPLMVPGIMAVSILVFILSWNEFTFALILNSGKTSTIPVAIAALQTSEGTAIGRVSAAATIAVTPIVVFGLFMKKYLIKGLTFGAVKG